MYRSSLTIFISVVALVTAAVHDVIPADGPDFSAAGEVTAGYPDGEAPDYATEEIRVKNERKMYFAEVRGNCIFFRVSPTK